MLRRLLFAALVAALVLPTTAASATHGCSDAEDIAIPFSLEVDGAEATGHYALPDEPPSGLVVFSHGYGHTSASWTHHLQNAATDLDVIAVAMDYRGTEIIPREGDVPTSRGWRVAEGAADGIAAAQHFEAACPGLGKIVNFGVSMGGNTSGLMAAEGATRSDGVTPLFDYWFNVEGATNVTETYHEASALAPVNAFAANAKADIEAEMGGTFTEVPEVYRERSVVTRAADIKAAGVKRVVLVHGLDDGLVPYNQSREMAAALIAEDVRYDFFTISRRSAESERDTTITGTVLSNFDPSYTSPLAGHSSERSTTNIVMRTALDRLTTLYLGDDDPKCVREIHLDGAGDEIDRETTVCP